MVKINISSMQPDSDPPLPPKLQLKLMIAQEETKRILAEEETKRVVLHEEAETKRHMLSLEFEESASKRRKFPDGTFSSAIRTNSESSHASTAPKSATRGQPEYRDLLFKLLFNEHGKKVFKLFSVNSENATIEICSKHDCEFLVESKVIKLSELLDLSGIQSNQAIQTGFSDIFKFTTDMKTESQLQACVLKQFVFDSHLSGVGTVEFGRFKHNSPLHDESQPFISLNAKPAACSRKCKITLELKSVVDNVLELIYQMVSRVVHDLFRNHLLRRSVSFGTNSQQSFVCVGLRTEYSVHIYFRRLKKLKKISQFWQSLELDGFGFLHDDAKLIWPAVLALGYNPWACQISLIGRSNCNVYGVWLLGKHIGVRDQQIYITTSPSFVIKVNARKTDFRHERDMLTDAQPAFYLRSWSRKRPSIEPLQESELFVDMSGITAINESVKIINAQVMDNSASIDVDAPWWSLQLDRVMALFPNTQGGVIFMRYICPMQECFSDETKPNELISQCIESLRCLHENGLTHRDIRIENIGQLLSRAGGDDDGEVIKTWVVFDFGNAGADSDEAEVFDVPASLIDFYPAQFQTAWHRNGGRDDCLWKWTASDDLQMLSYAVIYAVSILEDVD